MWLNKETSEQTILICSPDFSNSPMVQSAVHNRNVTVRILNVAISPLSTTTHPHSTNQANVPKLHVHRNSWRLYVDEKLLWSSPGRGANVTRSNPTKIRFISKGFSRTQTQIPIYFAVHWLADVSVR